MLPSTIVETASSGAMQGLVPEASSDETIPTSGSSLVLLHDHRPEPSSLIARFDFRSPSNPGWSTGGDGTCSFSRLSGPTPSDDTGPSAGVGGSGYYYYAEASSPRVQGDIFTLSYNGSVCASSGLLVATVHFSFLRLYHRHAQASQRCWCGQMEPEWRPGQHMAERERRPLLCQLPLSVRARGWLCG
jgi:hypothetical protein